MLSESSWHLDLTPSPSPKGRGEPEGGGDRCRYVRQNAGSPHSGECSYLTNPLTPALSPTVESVLKVESIVGEREQSLETRGVEASASERHGASRRFFSPSAIENRCSSRTSGTGRTTV